MTDRKQQISELTTRGSALISRLDAVDKGGEYTQELEDDFNDWCAAVELLLTWEQQERWEAWNLKATGPEVVAEAVRLLHE